MAQLSYFSTLQDVIETDDTELRQSVGYLSPDTVVEYVFHLRHQLKAKDEAIRNLSTSLSAASQSSTENTQLEERAWLLQAERDRMSKEVNGLKVVIAEKDQALATHMKSRHFTEHGLLLWKILLVFGKYNKTS